MERGTRAATRHGSEADAWTARGRTDDAIAVLEDATRREMWPGCVMSAYQQRCLERWMRARDRLASVYHQTGRTTEADGVDAELRRLFAVADPDYPPLVRLDARQAD